MNITDAQDLQAEKLHITSCCLSFLLICRSFPFDSESFLYVGLTTIEKTTIPIYGNDFNSFFTVQRIKLFEQKNVRCDTEDRAIILYIEDMTIENLYGHSRTDRNLLHRCCLIFDMERGSFHLESHLHFLIHVTIIKTLSTICTM